MIAFPNDGEAEPEGGLGGGALREHGIRDTRLIERALREQWPIPDEFRDPIVKRQVRIAIDPESSPREATSAARCLVSMQQQNTEAAMKALDKLVPDLHEVGATVEHRLGMQELLSEREYVEYLRHRTINEDCDAGAVCQIREPGDGQPVANGKAHGGPGPGTNGHRNGSE